MSFSILVNERTFVKILFWILSSILLFFMSIHLLQIIIICIFYLHVHAHCFLERMSNSYFGFVSGFYRIHNKFETFDCCVLVNYLRAKTEYCTCYALSIRHSNVSQTVFIRIVLFGEIHDFFRFQIKLFLLLSTSF